MLPEVTEMTNINHIKELAIKEPVTKDTKFNKGRTDCIKGNPYTEEAKYFLFCINYKDGGA